jgi:hypothetical protein
MTKAAAVEEHLARLARHPDVLRARRPAGQVLVYAGHVPQSLFLVLRGVLRLEPRDGEPVREVVVTPGRPLVACPPSALSDEADVTIALATDAEVVFVPRTLVQGDREMARLVEAACFKRLER